MLYDNKQVLFCSINIITYKRKLIIIYKDRYLESLDCFTIMYQLLPAQFCESEINSLVSLRLLNC